MERFLIRREAEFLAERFDILDRIHSGRENEEDRRARIRLLVGLVEWNRTILHELLAEFLLDEETERRPESSMSSEQRPRRVLPQRVEHAIGP